jgi:branched-chain amino acid transport system permease protein
MDLQIAMILGQDGVTNGAIYALLALSILLVFTVTRVLLIPLGEFVSFGALTMAAVQSGTPNSIVWLVAGLAVVEAALDLRVRFRSPSRRSIPLSMVLKVAYAFALVVLMYQLPLADLPMAAQVLLTLAVVVPLGPQMYRLFFQPIANAPSLVLLIVSIAVHVAMVGVGLLLFGPSGAQTKPFSEAGFEIGPLMINSQSLWVIAMSLALIIILYQFFERTIYGKALRATAINRVGSQLMGISPVFAGRASFLLASFIGTLSGVMIAPITTIYFDSGFIISLKGFVGAIIGGLVSYPLAAVGAVLVGLLEAFSSFWASTYKEVIVFTLIIPFLLWRSLTSRHVEEEE